MNSFSEDQRKHLDMVQAIITRMAGNSFLIRGWTVMLVSALFALAAKDANKGFVLIAYFPAVVFWCLDAYYLSQERLFRSLFVKVAASPTQTDVPLYSMKTAPGADDSWGSAFLSKTMLMLHLPLIGVITIAFLLLIKGD